jgi:chorismate synthase
LPFNESLLHNFLSRRRPGQSVAVTARQESDTPEILSGILNGVTLGTPIAVIVRNIDSRSEDYKEINENLSKGTLPVRPGHADDVWRDKFGHSDARGGGRSSGRETLARVIGGAFAQMFVQHVSPETNIVVFPRQVGPLIVADEDVQPQNALGVSAHVKTEIENMLAGLKTEGDSVGGIGEVWMQSPPKNLGQPVFHKLKSDLAAAFLSVGATTGLELGDGFSLVNRRGTEVHKLTEHNEDSPFNSYGGIRGGISTGETIAMRVAFKPTSSILDVAKKGRHDPCIVIRALPVLEAMAWLVLADHLLWQRLDRV